MYHSWYKAILFRQSFVFPKRRFFHLKALSRRSKSVNVQGEIDGNAEFNSVRKLHEPRSHGFIYLRLNLEASARPT